MKCVNHSKLAEHKLDITLVIISAVLANLQQLNGKFYHQFQSFIYLLFPFKSDLSIPLLEGVLSSIKFLFHISWSFLKCNFWSHQRCLKDFTSCRNLHKSRSVGHRWKAILNSTLKVWILVLLNVLIKWIFLYISK